MPHESVIALTFENLDKRSKAFCARAKAAAVQICFLQIQG